jgi:hypothetical protein
MQCTEDRQRDGETQIAQGYDFVQAAGPRDIDPRNPERNKQKYDARAAHRNHGARDLKKCHENDCLHVGGKRQLAWSIPDAFSRAKNICDRLAASTTTNRFATPQTASPFV